MYEWQDVSSSHLDKCFFGVANEKDLRPIQAFSFTVMNENTDVELAVKVGLTTVLNALFPFMSFYLVLDIVTPRLGPIKF